MKISVIIPVYNSEKYIQRCIESVINQTYSDWEMILVDDGSKDHSASLIDSACAIDSRIIAIHQENAGAGEARNKGIEAATGDYVVFLDSDDYIDKDYFFLLSLKAHESDIVFIDNELVSEDGTIIRSERASDYKKYNKEEILRFQMTGKMAWGGVRKAVSLNILRENNIKYTSHRIGEEALYSFRVLYAANKIGFIDVKPVYFYVDHGDSLSHTRMLDPWGDVAESMAEYLKTQGLYCEYANTVNAFRCTAAVISLDKITQFSARQDLKHNIAERMKKYQLNYDNSAGIDVNSMSYKAKLFVPLLKLGMTFPIILCSKMKQMYAAFKSKKGNGRLSK